jgi:hypothetical protein
MDTTGAFGRSKINPWLRVCILTASVLGLAQCNNQSPSVKNSSPTAPPVDKQVPHKYCYFFVAALYNNYQFLVSPDTFFLYHNEVLEKTWFDKHYKKVEERNYYVKKSLNEVRSANTKLFIELKNGIPKMKYDQISKDVK